MALGLLEIGLVLGVIVVLLWVLPKTLPQLGRSFREFREEVRRK